MLVLGRIHSALEMMTEGHNWSLNSEWAPAFAFISQSSFSQIE